MAAAILNAEDIGEKLSESLRTIAKLQGFSEQTVTLAEVGVILKACAGRTKVAKPDGVANKTRLRVLKKANLTSGELGVTINAGIRGPAGFAWVKVGESNRKSKGMGVSAWLFAGALSDGGDRFTASRFHFSGQKWGKLNDAVSKFTAIYPAKFEAAKKSAGLARQSWVKMADDLGIILEDIPGGGASPAAIAKARKAIASDGKTYANGIGTSEYEANKSFVATLTNRLPYWPKIALDSVLLSVIAGRTKYFEQNVAKAVFASHAKTVRAYPWIRMLGASSD